MKTFGATEPLKLPAHDQPIRLIRMSSNKMSVGLEETSKPTRRRKRGERREERVSQPGIEPGHLDSYTDWALWLVSIGEEDEWRRGGEENLHELVETSQASTS